MRAFASIEGMSNVFSWGFRSISKKTLGAEYPGFTADHSVVDRFSRKGVVLVNTRAKFAQLTW